mmetsp:Transcript_18241/g.27005  ORF Transcript_18241/g.27005 Transcript_18241/m.27005 type:complete len:158 (-) Transcript_18241:16-489(-)
MQNVPPPPAVQSYSASTGPAFATPFASQHFWLTFLLSLLSQSISTMVVFSTSALGFGRMGENRELKFALEKFWRNDIAATDLLAVAHQVEESAWSMQVDAGIDRITVGDYCLYDNVATWAESLGIIPKRFASLEPGTERMFSMCRGIDGAEALSKYS